MEIKSLIRRYRKLPEKRKIIMYGKFSFLKGMINFGFKIIVGIYYHSWFLIAVALYSLFIAMVKQNCSQGLYNNKDTAKDIHCYIRGAWWLSIGSMFYLAYSIIQIFFPSNTHYNIFIALVIAGFAFVNIFRTIKGAFYFKGRTMLVKEYKFTNFATGFNNLVLAQVACLSLAKVGNATKYNAVLGIFVGSIILGVSIFLIIDGYIKRTKYYNSALAINKKPHAWYEILKG